MANNLKEHAIRLKKVLAYTKTNAATLSHQIGMKQPTGLYHILSGFYGISTRIAQAIIKVYPEISFEWLTTGIGNMLHVRPTDPIHHKIKLLETQIAELKQLQGLNTFLEKLK